ncbi:MAG TPA: hypothetical protein VFE50_24275, partial [Cyclobacteriaceae bacterium]|nr:hypothetical protein [Cyclobacteriaceae bacterium]
MAEENNNQIAALREAGEHSPDAIIVINRSAARVEFANIVASNLLEINTGDDLRKITGLFESVMTTDREYVKSKVRFLDQQPATTNIEFRLMGSKGVPISLKCDAYFVAEKEFVYVIARDVTHDKKHEQYLVEYGARKNTLLDTLIHHLSG